MHNFLLFGQGVPETGREMGVILEALDL